MRFNLKFLSLIALVLDSVLHLPRLHTLVLHEPLRVAFDTLRRHSSLRSLWVLGPTQFDEMDLEALAQSTQLSLLALECPPPDIMNYLGPLRETLSVLYLPSYVDAKAVKAFVDVGCAFCRMGHSSAPVRIRSEFACACSKYMAVDYET